jgi:hypothetical protein
MRYFGKSKTEPCLALEVVGQELNAIQTQQLELYKAVKETLDRVLKSHLEIAVLLVHFR